VQYLSLGPHLVVAAATTVGACAAAGAAAYPSWQRGDTAGAIRMSSRVLLVVALIVVISMTMTGTTSTSGSLNLIPLAGIVESFESGGVVNGIENLIGNVAMFVPLGFLSVFALGLTVRRAAGLSAALSVAIETVQFLLGNRWSDIDDVLLNTVGGLAGALAATACISALRIRSSC
jgi:glycopeptide antibiotics resistance protein